ncbi:MAG: hypothetical protein CMP67_03030 [Flavobacteriales bacterium]|nr:hypothetical protein [Flavobacteriales bacterium]
MLFSFSIVKSQNYENVNLPEFKSKSFYCFEPLFVLSNGKILFHATNSYQTKHKLLILNSEHNAYVSSKQIKIKLQYKIPLSYDIPTIHREPGIQVIEHGNFIYVIYRDAIHKTKIKCSILDKETLVSREIIELASVKGNKRNVSIFCAAQNDKLGVYIQNKIKMKGKCYNKAVIFGKGGEVLKEVSIIENEDKFQPFKNQILFTSKGIFYKLVHQQEEKLRKSFLVNIFKGKYFELSPPKDLYHSSIVENPISKNILIAGFKYINSSHIKEWDTFFDQKYISADWSFKKDYRIPQGILMSVFDVNREINGTWSFSYMNGLTPQSLFRDFQFIDESTFVVFHCNGFYKNAYESFTTGRGSISFLRFDDNKLSWYKKIDEEQAIESVDSYDHHFHCTGDNMEINVVGYESILKNNNVYIFYNDIVRKIKNNEYGIVTHSGKVLNGQVINEAMNFKVKKAKRKVISTSKKNFDLKLVKIDIKSGDLEEKLLIKCDEKNLYTVPALLSETPAGNVILPSVGPKNIGLIKFKIE